MVSVFCERAEECGYVDAASCKADGTACAYLRGITQVEADRCSAALRVTDCSFVGTVPECQEIAVDVRDDYYGPTPQPDARSL